MAGLTTSLSQERLSRRRCVQHVPPTLSCTQFASRSLPFVVLTSSPLLLPSPQQHQYVTYIPQEMVAHPMVRVRNDCTPPSGLLFCFLRHRKSSMLPTHAVDTHKPPVSLNTTAMTERAACSADPPHVIMLRRWHTWPCKDSTLLDTILMMVGHITHTTVTKWSTSTTMNRAVWLVLWLCIPHHRRLHTPGHCLTARNAIARCQSCSSQLVRCSLQAAMSFRR